MCKFLILGLTGPTGAGKTTVGKIFEEFGYALIESDRLAREAVSKKQCIKQILKAFGDDILTDGVLNRALLAKRAFSSDEAAQKLNDITHPVILRMIKEKIDEFKVSYKAVIIDAPLLYEASLDLWCDKVVAVTADDEIRLKRIMKRDSIDEEAARLRMNRQKSNEFYAQRADYVINGASNNIKADVEKILQDLQVII